MEILFGIIFFHLLVIIRCHMTDSEKVPYISTMLITTMLVVYVVFMLYTMEKPR